MAQSRAPGSVTDGSGSQALTAHETVDIEGQLESGLTIFRCH